MAWRGEESSDVTAIPSSSIKWAQWIRVARNYQLRVGHKDQKEQNGKDTKPKDTKRDTFDGFAREVRFYIEFIYCTSCGTYNTHSTQDHDRLTQLLKQHFSIVLESKEISVRGWNWGVTDFQGERLMFYKHNS